jgi:hypothetical protein
MTISEVEVLRAQVKLLEEAHTECNDALRSAMEVAKRDGRQTNWPAFRESIRYALELSHTVINALADARQKRGASGL